MSVTKIIALSALVHSLHRVCEINAWWGSCPSPCFFCKQPCVSGMKYLKSTELLDGFRFSAVLSLLCVKSILNLLYS